MASEADELIHQARIAAGQLIRAARVQRGWSQQDLADRIQEWEYRHGRRQHLGVERGYVSEWELGKRGISAAYVRRLEAVLGIPRQRLLANPQDQQLTHEPSAPPSPPTSVRGSRAHPRWAARMGRLPPPLRRRAVALTIVIVIASAAAAFYVNARDACELVGSVVSEAAPQPGEQHRSSHDFGLDDPPPAARILRWSVTETQNADAVRFDIWEGASVGFDKAIFENLRNGAETPYRSSDRLYVANPGGTNGQRFRVSVSACP